MLLGDYQGLPKGCFGIANWLLGCSSGCYSAIWWLQRCYREVDMMVLVYSGGGCSVARLLLGCF